jgi:hypothetical protein
LREDVWIIEQETKAKNLLHDMKSTSAAATISQPACLTWLGNEARQPQFSKLLRTIAQRELTMTAGGLSF